MISRSIVVAHVVRLAILVTCSPLYLVMHSSGASASVTPALERDVRVLEALAVLPPEHAIDLGSARLIGEFNEVARRFGLHRTGPRSRDYSIKMSWAPERGRALFVGANHAQPHRLNDVWEFDLGALAWVLRYAPDNPRSYLGLGDDVSDVEYRDGALFTRRGGPAVIGHTWWGLAYHPGIRRLLWMNTWVSDVDKLVTRMGGDPASRYKGLPLWSFDPETARWELLRSAGPAPRAIFAGLLEYIDSLGDVIWHANNWQSRGTWRFDARNMHWQDLDAEGQGGSFQSQAPAPEQVGYYDPGRDILVVQRGPATYHFDVKRRTWNKVRSEPKDSPEVPVGHDARTPFVHDPSSGHGLLVDFRANTIWAYDPDAHSWTRLTPQGPPMPQGKKRLAYFDPLHRVLVVIDGVRVWAYRHAPENQDGRKRQWSGMW